MAYNRLAAERFAEAYDLSVRANLDRYLQNIEFEAFFIAEGAKIGGEESVRSFLPNETVFTTYAALFGGICFSLTALYDWYGTDWEEWIFQKVYLNYRLAQFGLEAWA